MGRWEAAGHCHGQQGTFFSSNTAAAKAICRGCPVLEICLWWAMAHEQPHHRHGVFGGTTPGERDELARTGITQELAWFYFHTDSKAYEAGMG